MKISLVTRSKKHKINHPLIKVLSPQEVDLKEVLLKKSGNAATVTGYSDQWHVLGHDIENRSVEPCKEGLLLSAFCNNDEDVLVIDNTSVDNIEVFTPDVLRRCVFIAHNADHEATWGKATGFEPMRYVCTMVNSKRLLSGEEGYRFDLVSEINRRLGYKAIPIWMDKDIRNTFNDCEYFINEQILYNAADTIRLKAILTAQYAIAQGRGQLYLLNSLCARIIKPIAQTEVHGIRHNTEKWLSIASDRQSRAEVIWKELDIQLQTTGLDLAMVNPALRKKQESQEKSKTRNLLRKEKICAQLQALEARGKQSLKSYSLLRDQLVKLEDTLGMSQRAIQEGISWTSNKQIIDLLRELKCPLPMAKDKKTHEMKPGVSKEARANWFIQNVGSPFSEIMNKIDAQKKLIHNVNSFGAEWIQKYVRNGRAYTVINQAGTTTGRFSSGNRKSGKFNVQQIPSGKEYRQCFIANPGRAMVTIDYKACEGIIMASLAEDLTVKKILEMPDMHSYFGTKCFREIYSARYQKTGDEKWKALSSSYVMDKSTIEKEKERHKFKNSAGLFPVAYGIGANKVAASAQLTLGEGQICIDVIKKEVPKVIEFLDQKASIAIKEGYVLHNTRTNSQRAFTPIIDHKKYGFPLSKEDRASVEAASRNSPIQGSNSDIIREAMCYVELWKNLFKLDCNFMIQAHDELVYDVPLEKKDWYLERIMSLMRRAAKNYLMKEINMDCDGKASLFWDK